MRQTQINGEPYVNTDDGLVEQLKQPLREVDMSPLSVWLPVFNAERIKAANKIERLEKSISELRRAAEVIKDKGL